MRSTRIMSSLSRLVTAEELEHYPDDDYRYELVDGHIIRMSPVALTHGQMVIQVGALLHQHLKDRGLGVVVTEVGFVLSRNPDTVRAPDVAFLRQERASAARGTGFVEGAPELAIEVASSDDRPSELRAKAVEYLRRGAIASVVVEPGTRLVIVHRRHSPPLVLTGADDVLDLSDVVPGFCCLLRDIFG